MSLLHAPVASALLAALALGQTALQPILVPPIAPNDGVVGGFDPSVGTAGEYRMYLLPGLGTGTVGAPTLIGVSSPLAARLNHFVIDQANADIIATANPTVAGGPVEVWRIQVSGTTVLSETLLTTLSGTNGLLARAVHRDASGCILVLSRPSFFSGTFTVHRVAITRGGGLAFQIPITTTGNEMLDAIATDPAGQILLGGTQPPYSSAAPGVTLTVSQAGGTAVTTSVIANFHVIAAATSSIGQPALGLSPQILPPTANYSCGGAFGNFQFNTPPFTTLWNDIELNPAGTQFVLTGVGAFAFGAPGVIVRIGAIGCVAGTPSAPIFFPHGMNQAAIAFPSQRYGCGCPPSTNVLPQIGELAPPTIGLPWVVTLTSGVPNSTAMLVSGRGDLFFQGSPLPQPLSVFGGQPSCFLLNGANFVFGLKNTDAAGAATNQRAIPNDPTLIGTRLFSQWLVNEVTPVPSFSTAGLISTIQ